MALQKIQFKLKGSSFENRQESLAWLKNHKTQVWLEREPENQFDHNAIRVMMDQNGTPRRIGYFPKEIAATLAPLVDTNQPINIMKYIVIGGYKNKSYGLLLDVAFVD